MSINHNHVDSITSERHLPLSDPLGYTLAGVWALREIVLVVEVFPRSHKGTPFFLDIVHMLLQSRNDSVTMRVAGDTHIRNRGGG